MTERENLFITALVAAYQRAGRIVTRQTLTIPAMHLAQEIPCEDGEIAPMFAEAEHHGLPTRRTLLKALRTLEARRYKEVPTPSADGILYSEYVRRGGENFIPKLTGSNWMAEARKYLPYSFSTKEKHA